MGFFAGFIRSSLKSSDIIVFMAAQVYTDSGVNQVVDHWYEGFWMLLEFGMQTVLILVTGFAIALSPPIGRLIDRLAWVANTPGSVYLIDHRRRPVQPGELGLDGAYRGTGAGCDGLPGDPAQLPVSDLGAAGGVYATVN